jgi:hypothetical protein
MKTLLEEMVNGYLECALWSTHAYLEEGEENPKTWDEHNYAVSDISEKGMKQATEDCEAFLKEALPLLTEEEKRDTPHYSWESYLGHNFWLTREGHGAGFWDGRYENGDALTKLCKPWGNASDSMCLNEEGEIDL